MTETSDTATDLDAGLAHHEAGRFAAAEVLYRRFLDQEPDHADALNLLGVLLQDSGELTESIAILSRAVAVDPEFPEALANLARAQCAAGDPAAAKLSSQRAVELDPDLGEAHLQLARSLLALQDNAAAMTAATRAAALSPGSVDAQLFLGHAESRLKNYPAAAAAYRAADRLAPDRYEALLALAGVLAELKQFDDAVACCRRAVAVQPENVQAYVALGGALRGAEDFPGSVAALHRAVELAPDNPEVWLQQGDNDALMGRFDAAAEAYNRAHALDPTSSEPLTHLASIGKLTDAASAHAPLQAALSDPDRPTNERVSAGFALGTLLDEAGNYEAAFASYAAANRMALESLRAAGSGFDLAQFRRRIDHLRTAFAPSTIEATRGWGNPSEVPVFVVGMPRTGTTLVEQILASHRQVYGAGERKDIFDIAVRLEGDKATIAPSSWDQAAVRQESAAQLAQLRALGGSSERVIDKLPDNILQLGHIAVLFPSARVIICRRDPRDVGLSCFFQRFRDGMAWTYDLADTAARASEIERLTEYWRGVLPLRMLEVQYETLVGDLEGESRRLIDFLGLEWDDNCLSFHATERSVLTASFWQVRQKVYASSVGRWRHYSGCIQPLLDGLIGLLPVDGETISVPQILAGARSLLSDEQIQPAESAYRLVIEREPSNVEALYELGRLVRGRGDARQAVSLLRRAVAGKPGDGTMLVELARAYRGAGDFRTSADLAGEAVALNQADASAHFMLGSTRLDLNDAAGARDALATAIELAPESADAQHYFAMACMRLKDFFPAAAALRQAVRLKPDDAEYLAKLGRVLCELREYAEAVQHLRHAIDLAPEDGRIHLALVMALWGVRDVEGTRAACVEAMRLAPNTAELWVYIGYCEAALGRFADAADCYRKAIALDPNMETARFALALSGYQAEVQPDVARLLHVLEDPDQDERERLTAGYALGAVLDRAGDYDAAWRAYEAVNQLAYAWHQAAGRLFDPIAFEAHVEATITSFVPATFAAMTGLGDASDLPVFVVGMPRSGTTLVEQIASSHPNVFGAGELDDMLAIAARLDANSADPRPTAWDPAAIAREADTYLRTLRHSGGEAKRVIDKLPGNYQLLGHIAVLFPHARVIVCRRDFRDVGLSCFLQHFDDNLSWTTSLADIAARAQAFERLMSHWRAVLPLEILEVQYEDLVGNLESESRRLIAFLGLDWDPACLAFHETERAVMTASLWQVRQPLFTSSVGRWRNYRRHLRPLLAGLAGLVPDEGDATGSDDAAGDNAAGNDDWDALAAEPAAALAIAVSHQRAGRVDYAEPIYHALLRRSPDDPTVLHLLGLIQVDRDNPAEAVALITRSLTLRPDVASVLSGLARAHCAAGNADAAIEAARRAIALDPDLPDALLQLGYALFMRHDNAEAVTVLRRATEVAPDMPEAWMSLATAQTHLNDHAAAAQAWQGALRLKPDDPNLLIDLAGSLGELGRHAEALATYRQADALAPGNPRAQIGIAGTLALSGDVAVAIELCHRALETTPDWSKLWLLLADCQAMQGDYAAAADAYRRALALEPGSPDALHGLSVIGEHLDETAEIDAAASVVDDPSRPVRDRVAAGFTLGRVRDRRGEYDQAFDAYALANSLLHAERAARGFAFDRSAFRHLVDQQIATTGAQTFADTAGWGDPSELPVFIVGMPRSGTSLVEQIAASHPLVFGAGEQKDIFAVLTELSGGQLLGRSCATWDRASVQRETTAYVQRLRGLGGDAVRIIDKHPDNILWLGQIAVLFPRVRIVLCRRDLRDIGLSCFFQYFREDRLTWTDDLADCAYRTREVERLIDHWRNVLPSAILEIQYETLVANLEPESRRLIDFLGLEWDPACLAFHETERTVMTASHWQVRQPLYDRSVGRWRHYRRHIQPLLAGLAGLVPPEGGEDWDALAADPATALAIVVSHYQAGRRDEAEPICRAVLRHNPDDPAALHLLGLLLLDRGETAESVALITQSLTLRPDVAPVLADLAGAHRAAGDAEAAVEAAERAVALDPDLPVALVQLGVALLTQQDSAGAVPVLRHATEVAPRLVEAWVALATALADQKDHGSAAEAWEAALALQPDDPELLTAFATALAELKRFDEALAAFRQAATLAPDAPAAQYGIAGSLMHLGDVAAAVDTCRRALEKTPDARFWSLLANCEAALGHFDAAAEAYRSALALDPGSAGTLRDLVTLGDALDDDAAKDSARAILSDQSRPVRDRASAGFALGQVCDRSGDYDEAFAAYAVANRMLHDDRNAHGYVFDRSKFRTLVDRQIATFDARTFAATADWGDPSEQPVFVVGMPRSGTSLVEQIAASHKLVFGAGEQTEMFDILTALENEQETHHPLAWNRAPVRREAMAYVQHLRDLGGDAARIIDKQPENILCLGQIAIMFPRARIVVCRRDLRDVSLSCFFQFFRDDLLVWTDDLADCGYRAREIDRLMEHWRKVLPIPILEVQYETLVANLESESRRLIDFLGLDWDPACLAFHDTERTVMTASHWQVRQPLYASSVGRWRHYRHHLEPLLRELEGVALPDDEGLVHAG
jgi:tetratricopeptide (TPR) repeat protein